MRLKNEKNLSWTVGTTYLTSKQNLMPNLTEVDPFYLGWGDLTLIGYQYPQIGFCFWLIPSSSETAK
jgi:hypothetical protein